MTGVVYVANSAKVGGGNRVLMDIIDGLDRERFSPLILAPARGPLEEWAVHNRVPTRILAGNGDGSYGRIALLRQVGSIIAAVHHGRARIIHAMAQTCYRPVGLGGLLTRSVRICHLGFPPTPDEIDWVFKSGPDAVVGCYQGQVHEVSEMVRRASPRARLVAITNGVDTRKYAPLGADASSASSPLRFGAKHVVVIVGHLSEVKGYPTFFRAASQIVQRVGRVAFLAVGDETTNPGYGKELEELVQKLGISDNVRFLGRREDVADIVRAADVMVLPSQAEGLPIAILEAMACGKPVVATPVGGVPEAVVDGKTGILVPPGDHEALARAVVQLLESPRLAGLMGTEGRRVAETLFSRDRFVREVESLYEDMLEARRGQS